MTTYHDDNIWVDCCPIEPQAEHFHLPRDHIGKLNKDGVHKVKSGRIIFCIPRFDENVVTVPLYENYLGIKFKCSNPKNDPLWRKVESGRDGKKVRSCWHHDTQHVTPLRTAWAIKEAADLRCEVIWESWGMDPRLKRATYDVRYPILWDNGRAMVFNRWDSDVQEPAYTRYLEDCDDTDYVQMDGDLFVECINDGRMKFDSPMIAGRIQDVPPVLVGSNTHWNAVSQALVIVNTQSWWDDSYAKIDKIQNESFNAEEST